MKAIYGITHHSPFVVREYIENWRSSLPEAKQEKLVTQFLGFGHKLKPDALVVLIPTLSCLIEHRAEMEKSDAVVFVFDSPVVLVQTSIPMLDAIGGSGWRWSFRKIDQQSFIDILRNSLNTKDHVELGSLRLDLVPTLLNNVKGSLTQTLLNITYRCRVPHKRREITHAYATWLLSGGPPSDLIETLRTHGVDDETIEIALRWFESKHGAEARKICRDIAKRQREMSKSGKKKAINYEKLCKGTSVEPFDLKYLFSTVRGAAFENVNLSTNEIYQQRKTASKKAANEKPTAEEQALIDAENQDYEFGLDNYSDDLDFSELDEVNY